MCSQALSTMTNPGLTEITDSTLKTQTDRNHRQHPKTQTDRNHRQHPKNTNRLGPNTKHHQLRKVE